MVSNIWVASADNHIQAVKSHLDSGSYSANSKDPNGYTPIHAAASYGHIELLKFLIERGGDINIQDNDGDTPLHHVEDLKVAKFIVEELNADLKVTNNEKKTAAQYIEEEEEFPEIVQYLTLPDQPCQSHSESTITDFLKFNGNDVKYSLESSHPDENPEEEEERREKLEAIVNSDNPEEALRQLVTSAVKEQFHNFKSNNDGSSSKKRKN